MSKLTELIAAARKGGSRRHKTANQLLMRDYLDDHAEDIVALIEAAKVVTKPDDATLTDIVFRLSDLKKALTPFEDA